MDEDALSVGADPCSKSASTKSICFHRKKVSREAFFAQAILIYIISVACVINLSIGTGPSHVWVALLSGCLGYILPEPRIRREKVKSLLGVPKFGGTDLEEEREGARS